MLGRSHMCMYSCNVTCTHKLSKCKELARVGLRPHGVEAYGAWGTEPMESFSLLASRLAISSNRAKAEVLAALYGRLDLNLVRANATAILSRYLVPDYCL